MPFKPKEIPNLIGRKIDSITVLSYHGKTHYRVHQWNVRCDCGKELVMNQDTLLDNTRYHSCGCFSRKFLTTGDSNRCRKAGVARAEKRNKDGVNVDMLFREKTISTNTSGVQGVSWSKTARKWHVYVGYKNKRYTIGYFEDFETAKQVRLEAMQQIKNNNFAFFYTDVTRKPFS